MPVPPCQFVNSYIQFSHFICNLFNLIHTKKARKSSIGHKKGSKSIITDDRIDLSPNSPALFTSPFPRSSTNSFLLLYLNVYSIVYVIPCPSPSLRYSPFSHTPHLHTHECGHNHLVCISASSDPLAFTNSILITETYLGIGCGVRTVPLRKVSAKYFEAGRTHPASRPFANTITNRHSCAICWLPGNVPLCHHDENSVRRWCLLVAAYGHHIITAIAATTMATYTIWAMHIQNATTFYIYPSSAIK